MKWLNSVLSVAGKIKSIIKIVIAVEAAINAFEEVIKSDKELKKNDETK